MLLWWFGRCFCGDLVDAFVETWSDGSDKSDGSDGSDKSDGVGQGRWIG